MWKRRIRSHRVSVIPCTAKPGCYRWIVHAPEEGGSERSGYAFATPAGARASGESWRREFEAGKAMA